VSTFSVLHFCDLSILGLKSNAILTLKGEVGQAGLNSSEQK